MIFLKRLAVAYAVAISALSAIALEPCSYTEFYDKVSDSPDIQPGVWSSRSNLCLQKARETGWLMLWFLAARGESYDCSEFLKSNLCNQPFCDVVNNYKYLILCYEDYSKPVGRKLKNLVYGYPEPEKILDENTGQMVENHRGYPIRTVVGYDSEGKEIYNWCDYPPSIHLIKVDVNTNIIFHICKREGFYDMEFSPYADKFPIPSNMNVSQNAFAPWFKQYLDMYPVAEQIAEYEEHGSSVSPTVITNTTYEAKVTAVTETINPTVYQMALHRDNLLFRSVTMLRDAAVFDRIGEDFHDFDDKMSVRNSDGKWYIGQDRTLSSRSSTVSDATSIDIMPNENCGINLRQRYGKGFMFLGYNAVITTTNVVHDVVAETGSTVLVTNSHTVITTSASPFLKVDVDRGVSFSTNIISGKIYRVTTGGNATFDVFSTN